MSNCSYSGTMEGYDVEFQKRKRRIAEIEDSIENLKLTVDDDEKENKRYQSERNYLEMEEKVSRAKFDAVTTKKIKICDEIDQYEREIIELTQQLTQYQARLDESEVFMQQQLNESVKCLNDFYGRYLKYPWVSNFEDMKKSYDEMEKAVKQKQDRVISLEKELSDVLSRKNENWMMFTDSCIKVAGGFSQMRNLNSQVQRTLRFGNIGNFTEKAISKPESVLADKENQRMPFSTNCRESTLRNLYKRFAPISLSQNLNRSIISQGKKPRTSPKKGISLLQFPAFSTFSFPLSSSTHFTGISKSQPVISCIKDATSFSEVLGQPNQEISN